MFIKKKKKEENLQNTLPRKKNKQRNHQLYKQTGLSTKKG